MAIAALRGHVCVGACIPASMMCVAKSLSHVKRCITDLIAQIWPAIQQFSRNYVTKQRICAKATSNRSSNYIASR
jgi:hypothetical protein